jgi:Major intrinsic protein
MRWNFSQNSGSAAGTTCRIPGGYPRINEFAESKTIKNESARPRKTACSDVRLNAVASVRLHWPEYLMEAGELALNMFLVCTFAALLQHPTSPVRHFIPSAICRRALMGLLMGLTVVAIVMTPWGKQSGGHFNPAISTTFYRRGKLAFWDALSYVAAQFAGAASGVRIAAYGASRCASK